MSSAKKHAPITDGFAQAFIDRAHEMYNDDGVIEVDSQASSPHEQISCGEAVEDVVAEGGLYVKAWIWVSLSDLTKEARERILGKKLADEWEASRG